MKRGFRLTLLYDPPLSIGFFLYLALCLLIVALAGFVPAVHLWELPAAVQWAVGLGVGISAILWFAYSEENDPQDQTMGLGPVVLAVVPLLVLLGTIREPSVVAPLPRWPLILGSIVTLLPLLVWTSVTVSNVAAVLNPDPVASSDTPD